MKVYYADRINKNADGRSSCEIILKNHNPHSQFTNRSEMGDRPILHLTKSLGRSEERPLHLYVPIPPPSSAELRTKRSITQAFQKYLVIDQCRTGFTAPGSVVLSCSLISKPSISIAFSTLWFTEIHRNLYQQALKTNF